MKRTLCGVALAIALFSGVGCTTVAATDKKLIQDQSAVGVGVLNKWDSLSDDQKKQAYWKSTRGFHTLNYTHFDVPVPDAFQNDPWKKPADGVAPVGSR